MTYVASRFFIMVPSAPFDKSRTVRIPYDFASSTASSITTLSSFYRWLLINRESEDGQINARNFLNWPSGAALTSGYQYVEK